MLLRKREPRLIFINKERKWDKTMTNTEEDYIDRASLSWRKLLETTLSASLFDA